jgi:hypothetical protein
MPLEKAMALVGIVLVGLVVGLVVVRLSRRRLGRAALIAPTAGAAVCLALMVHWFHAEALAFELQYGERPCGAFGSVAFLCSIGSALLEFAVVLVVIGGITTSRSLRRRRASRG